MRTIEELIFEANRLFHTETVGGITADGILAALATLEAAQHAGSASRRPGREPYQPANPDHVLEYFTQGDGSQVQRTTAAEAYRAIYGRDGNTGELRTAAAALRAAGWVAFRSNGRTLFRRRDPAVDGLLGLDNGAEIHERVTAWAHEQARVFHTAADIFREIFGRKATGVEARAVGTVLREIGFGSRKYGGRLIFTNR